MFLKFKMLNNLFLQIYSLRKQFYTSPANRNSYYFHNKLNYQIKFKKLSFFKKSNAGKNDSGKIVARTKTSRIVKQKSIRINYNLRYFKLCFVAGIQFIPFKNRLLSLIYFSNGSVTYYLTSETQHLFFILNIARRGKIRKFRFKNSIFMMIHLRKLSFISCIEITPNFGAQYSRSPGTKSKIVKFDALTHSALIQLPSKIKKLFSYYVFVLLGRISASLHFKCYNHKSGYWRSFGVKPIVRGVAKNPVDHPHGGRTKAIRYQRTPWGKTTKYK